MSKSKTTSELTAERAIAEAVKIVGPFSHLRIKAVLDKQHKTIHEPSEIWRALACSGLFARDLKTLYFFNPSPGTTNQ